MTKQFSSLVLSVLCALPTACQLDASGRQASIRSASPDRTEADADSDVPKGDAASAADAGSEGGLRSDAEAGAGPSDGSLGPKHDAHGADSGLAMCSADPVCAVQVRRKISFDARQLEEKLVDFPVLIKLDSTRIDYAKAQTAGRNLRFVGSDGTTLLAHEVEHWQADGTSWVWVKVPRIEAGAFNHIYMIYGGESAPPSDRSKEVFSADYEAVYHLADDLSDRTLRDALGQHHGTIAANMNSSARVTARIGSGIELDGINDMAQLGTIDSSNWQAFTLEAWVLPQANPDGRILCQAASSTWKDHIICLGIVGDSLRVRLTTSGQGGEFESHDVPGVEASKWMHVAVAWDAQSHALRVLRNGEPVAGFAHFGTGVSPSQLPMLLGNISPDGDRFLKGVVDEVRISSVARSNAWLQASVVSALGALTTYGSEEPLP
jgi:biopolymer transport protein ExbB